MPKGQYDRSRVAAEAEARLAALGAATPAAPVTRAAVENAIDAELQTMVREEEVAVVATAAYSLADLAVSSTPFDTLSVKDGDVLVLRSASAEDGYATAQALADNLAESGKNVTIVPLTHEQSLSVMDEAAMNAAGWERKPMTRLGAFYGDR